MMKTKILLIFITIFTVNIYGQFQEDFLVPGQDLLDANTIELRDGTNDYIVSGTLVSPNETKLQLIRIDDVTGNIVWSKNWKYGSANTRGFDIINYNDGSEKIAVTGFVEFIDATGTVSNSTFIALIDATTGNYIDVKVYQIPGNLQNSQGLHIIYTEQEINMITTPGFVVGGFINDGYSTSITGNNVGFVLRTDINLNQLWTKLLDGNLNATNDFDFVNNITETNDGYFITGSVSGLGGPPFFSPQGGVLATKIDNLGTQVWDNSYIFGNAYDVGVDAYYDFLNDEIYLLANYSVTHHFGVTVLDNSSGAIDFTKSWSAMSSDLNKYGFTIDESKDPNHLVISGYIRDESYIDASGVSISVQTTPFTYTFEKVTGDQVASYQYNVPYVFPVALTDFFFFWNSQMPFAYYPDMFLTSKITDTHFLVGYRTRNSGLSEIELIQLDLGYRNVCENEGLVFTHNSIVTEPVSTTLSPVIPIQNTLTHVENIQDYLLESCNPTAGIDEEIQGILSIYPNPVKDLIHVNLTETNINKFEIYDILGKKVLSKKGLNTLENIDVRKLKHGIYFLKVFDNNNATFTSKFIKK